MRPAPSAPSRCGDAGTRRGAATRGAAHARKRWRPLGRALRVDRARESAAAGAPKSLCHSSKFGSCNRSQTQRQANKPRNEHTHLRHRADRMRSSKHARDRMLWKNFSFAFVRSPVAAPCVSRGRAKSSGPTEFKIFILTPGRHTRRITHTLSTFQTHTLAHIARSHTRITPVRTLTHTEPEFTLE